jgi:hypothetical protein
MDVLILVLKNALLALLVLPFALIYQWVMFKEEKQLKLKGIIFAWLCAIVLFSIKDFFHL